MTAPEFTFSIAFGRFGSGLMLVALTLSDTPSSDHSRAVAECLVPTALQSHHVRKRARRIEQPAREKLKVVVVHFFLKTLDHVSVKRILGNQPPNPTSGVIT
jgi:hypothetical protein